MLYNQVFLLATIYFKHTFQQIVVNRRNCSDPFIFDKVA